MNTEANTIPDIGSSAKSIAESAMGSASKAMENTSISNEKGWGKVKATTVSFVKESWVVLLIIAVMILLVVIVVYIFYMIKKNSLQKLVLHTDVIDLNNRSVVPRIVKNTDATLSTVNGQEFSYSFWLFLSDTFDITVDHKMVFTRGAVTNGSISNTTSPVVALGDNTNSMYLAVSTTKAVTNATIAGVLAQDSGYLVVKIPYVPLQRWINVVMVVKDSNMYIYVDADILSIVSVESISTDSLRYAIRGTTGDISIGDSVNSTPGYLSFTQFFNFALTQNDVTNIYKNGPSKKSWLSFLGMGNYGVRSPVYKMN